MTRTSQSPLTTPAIILVGIVSVYTTVVLPLIVSAAGRQFTVSPAVAGYIASAEMGGVALGTLIAGMILHRFDRRRIVLAGAGIAVLVNVLSLVAGSFAPLLVLRIGSGFGSGLMLATMAAAVGDTGRAERIFGIFVAGAFLAAAISFSLLSGPVARLGTSPVFIVLAALNALSAIAARWFPAHAVVAPSRSDDAGAAGGAAGPTLPVVAGLIGILCFYLGIGSAWPVMGSIGQAFGVDAAAVGRVLAGTSIAGLIGAVTATALAMRFGRIAPLTVGLGATAASLAVLLVLQGSGFAWLPLIFLFAWNFSVPYMMGALAAFDPSGRAVAFNMTLQYIGFAVGPLIAAAVGAQAGLVAVLVVGVLGCGASLANFVIAVLADTHQRSAI